ncbi:MAG: DHH family phosphoesterase [Thermodesulfobacteriota bacterium]|nr:DHH family phosphoesterase [Thermodesulfobacteriota bacterium]
MAAFTKQELEKSLLGIVKGKRKVLILTHDNPDPDSIASAFGLQYIFKTAMGVSSIISYGGIVGRAENQSMIRFLDIKMTPFSQISPRNYSVIAMVDCQPHTGNVSLPDNIIPTIVVDHHPLRKSSLKASHMDVRSDMGSASTIITQYIRQLGLPVDRRVATALFYGIKSDTRDMGRRAVDADIRASVFVYPYTMQKKLARIEHPKMPKEYFVELFRVLENAMIYGDAIVARVDTMGWPEMIGEYADNLIRIEGTKWCMCYGRHNGSLLFSIRTTHSSYMAGALAHKICRGIGSGGGHETYAAGKINMDQALKKVKDPENIIIKRFLKDINTRALGPKRLIEPSEDNSRAIS